MAVNSLLILKARAEARAILFYQYCEYEDLEAAIALLREYALKSDLVADLGAAAVMKIIYAAFDLPADGDVSKSNKIVVANNERDV